MTASEWLSQSAHVRSLCEPLVNFYLEHKNQFALARKTRIGFDQEQLEASEKLLRIAIELAEKRQSDPELETRLSFSRINHKLIWEDVRKLKPLDEEAFTKLQNLATEILRNRFKHAL